MTDAVNLTIETVSERYTLASHPPSKSLASLVASLGCGLVSVHSHGQMWLQSTDARHHPASDECAGC